MPKFDDDMELPPSWESADLFEDDCGVNSSRKRRRKGRTRQKRDEDQLEDLVDAAQELSLEPVQDS